MASAAAGVGGGVGSGPPRLEASVDVILPDPS